jgi:3-oxoacyl-[acyl-carrier protein] reductase
MDLGLNGKVAIVGSASKGLGRAVALGLAREGSKIAMFSRSEDSIGRAADEIRAETGAEVEALAADVSSGDDLQRVFDSTIRRFGRVDVLFNNSGGPPPGTFDDFDDDAWVHAFELLLQSSVRLTRLVLPGMRERKWGRIINSTSTSVKQPIPRLMLSNALRGGVTGMANTLAREVARDGITVNNLAPGRIFTDRVEQIDQDAAIRAGKSIEEIRSARLEEIPAGRYGTPEEFAAAAVFLASEQAAYITGVTLQVDGGLVKSTY